jgi:hypothetical protein
MPKAVVIAVLSFVGCSGNHGLAVVDGGVGGVAADAGVCSGVHSTAGGPCTCDSDCSPPGVVCGTEADTGLPGGDCVQTCLPADPAPPGYACTGQPDEPYDFLLPICDVTHPCRDGYACLINTTTHIGHCEARCAEDAQCAINGHCDLYTGYCQREAPGLGLGQACTSNQQCKSDACTPPLDTLPTFCLTTCALNHPVCPEAGACRAISSNPAYTLGWCYAPCPAGTCPDGFSCSGGYCLLM